MDSIVLLVVTIVSVTVAFSIVFREVRQGRRLTSIEIAEVHAITNSRLSEALAQIRALEGLVSELRSTPLSRAKAREGNVSREQETS